jgi:hypothetical protein
VVSGFHFWSFPNQIAVLDGKTGRLISEYWHRGQLRDMVVIDLARDGRPKVLPAGVNDAPEFKCATLVLFDGSEISGANCDPQGQPYFQGMGRGTLDFGGRIQLIVREGIKVTDPYMVYELDYNLAPVSAMMSRELIAEYKKLQDAGKLPIESPYVTADRSMRQIRVVQGS